MGGFLGAREGGFAEADGGFEGKFVEGVEAVFYVGGFDGGVSGVDAGFDLERGLSVRGGGVLEG